MIQTDLISYGIDGNYSGAVQTGTTDGQNLILKDAIGGTYTLSELLAHVAEHSISDHTGMDTDFATQYYNEERLASYLADATNGNVIGISGDVDANATIGDHVGDGAIHQRVPKFVLRVAKGGQDYSSIGAALAAIPTSGGTAPAPDQWWRVEVAPGVYNEAVVLDKQWVEVVGSGQEVTRIVYDNSAAAGTYPLYVAVGDVVVDKLGIETSNPATVTENIAALIGPKTGTPSSVTGVVIRGCRIYGPGNYALWISTNWAPSILDTIVEAGNGTQAMVQGVGNFLGCSFPALSFRASVECRNEANLARCKSKGPLLSLVNCTATVANCFSEYTGAGVQVAEGGTGNTFSTVRWDGAGYNSTFGAGALGTGTVQIDRFGDSGLSTSQSIDINWFLSGSDKSQRHFISGHSGGDGSETDAFGGGGPDHHFYRGIAWGADVGGDVFAIGDKSAMLGAGSNSTNVLALYIGGDNSSGKYLRWGLGDDTASMSELGYISRDGKVHAPGFVGDGTGLSGIPQLASANAFTAPQSISASGSTALTAFDVVLDSYGTAMPFHMNDGFYNYYFGGPAGFTKVGQWFQMYAQSSVFQLNSNLPWNMRHNGTVRIGLDGNGIGFFGVTPIARPAALTAANASAVNSGDSTTDTVINNMRTRLNELASSVQSLGLVQ